jgi:UDP-N-acetylglucosamine:LPS N-acetylglucosamine transferase
MAFPQFTPGKKRLLFFSRGRGSGHAIPDIAIARELQKLRPDVEVRFVSYATGARTIEAHQFPLFDIDLPEAGSVTHMTVVAGQLVGRLDPGLVVAHEEFAAIPAAKIFGKTTVFLTDFFVEPEQLEMQALKYADRVLFLGNRGLFDEPPWVQGKVDYVGRVLREFDYTRLDRLRARRELGLDETAAVIAVLPGSWTESTAPILELVAQTFVDLDVASKRLVWVAGEDYDLVRERLRNNPEALVVRRDWQMDRLMAATDVAITKANRMTVLELDSLGIPSVALSPKVNRIDDKIVGSLESVSFYELDRMDAQTLRQELCSLLGGARPEPAVAADRGRAVAAERISELLPVGGGSPA